MTLQQTTEAPIIDMFKLAQVWQRHLENGGLNDKNVSAITSNIQSPVLVIGGGAGLVRGELIRRGFEVKSVDRCPNMIEQAKTLRNVDIILSEGSQLPFDAHCFSSVLVNTGVVSRKTLEEGIVDGVMREAGRVVRDDGIVAVGYMLDEEGSDVPLKPLGLFGKPSNFGLFAGAESLDVVRDRFIAQTEGKSDLICDLFTRYERLLNRRRTLINLIADDLTRQGVNAQPFIAENLGFFALGLSNTDVDALKASVTDNLGPIRRIRPLVTDGLITRPVSVLLATRAPG